MKSLMMAQDQMETFGVTKYVITRMIEEWITEDLPKKSRIF